MATRNYIVTIGTGKQQRLHPDLERNFKVLVTDTPSGDKIFTTLDFKIQPLSEIKELGRLPQLPSGMNELEMIQWRFENKLLAIYGYERQDTTILVTLVS